MCQRFSEVSFKGRAFFLHPLSGVVLCLLLSHCVKKEKSKTSSVRLQGEKKNFSGVCLGSWLEAQQTPSLWLATKDTALLPAKSPLTSV